MKFVPALLIGFALVFCNRGEPQKERTMKYKHTNRLINETSPYLRQHAHNPVDWYPWGEEAFRKAKEEDKPVLLSVGYAACHWCHVMEKESFEDEQTAALMNERFINIKVDREERPDVDRIYMQFLQMFTGSGGWPMTVFLTPDKKPFYGGTYFPPEDRYGRPGFKKLLRMVSDFYRNNKKELQQNLEQVEQGFRAQLAEEKPGAIPGKEDFNRAVEELMRYYDPEYGGIGQAPKFPATEALFLLLRKYRNDDDEDALHMVAHTLRKMAAGGIYDQLAGGFARYSVDRQWLVPHFEKMLYDNAGLARLFLATYQATGDSFFLDIARQVLAFVRREMMSPEGGFYSSMDADSEGEEGRYYVWTKREILDALGARLGEIFCRYYGVTEKGNFEGKNILHVAASLKELSDEFRLALPEVEKILREGRENLLKLRQQRVPPATDTKIIVSWNGLMLSAFADAYQITGDPEYAQVLRTTLDFLRNKLFEDNELRHTYKDGRARFAAYLDDHAHLIAGLLDSYQALFDPEPVRLAQRLMQTVERDFHDPEQGGYFYAPKDQTDLVYRVKDRGDASIPSGSGVMAANLLRMFHLTEEQAYLTRAEQLFAKYGRQMIDNTYGFASYLNALDFYLRKPFEIVIVRGTRPETKPFLIAIHRRFLPNKIVLVKDDRQPLPAPFSLSLIAGREAVDNRTTVYVCRDFACSLPIVDSEQLERELFSKD